MEEHTDLPEHSLAKVRLLGAYLKRFLSVISNDGFTQRICIYDLFCGDGSGSARVVMNEVKGVYFTRSARSLEVPKIDCYFNDLDQTRAESAEKLISEENLLYPEIGSVQFSSRHYKDLIHDLIGNLDASRTTKNFVFIDPYGYKDIRASHIRDLLERGNTEVLLWLPTQFMYRFDSNGRPVALESFIEEIVDKDSWNKNANVWNFIEQLKSGFQNKFGRNTYVDIFSIKKDAQTVFCLFFFCTHIKGFEKMLDAKWDLDSEQGRGWHYGRTHQSSLFSEQVAHPLEEDLVRFLKDSARNNREIYEFTLRRGYLPKHTTEILKSLQDQGALIVTGPGGAEVRKGSFYINYKSYKNEPNRVEFRLK